MLLDEKLKLLEEVTAALNKEQSTNGRYIPSSNRALVSALPFGKSKATRYSSVPPSIPEGGSDHDIEMADGHEDPIEVMPTEEEDNIVEISPCRVRACARAMALYATVT
ncbi:hypothetical protein PHLCEN_2v8752 [Hermanssonia centrifuga]|uniref:Uncharacterized protein n=1 Tax=Hermanssonia centrifuga TaxID=98765 RepID=A0A2R6NSW2_9APHY|nr:hypothetical protein PHLCEN_2v8752 [Hermanssonia centrifuga]